MRTIESKVEIAPGVDMPILGLGTYKSEEGPVAQAAVEAALSLGYRGIDTASLYGNERSIGAGVRASGLPRDEVFITTKVWNDEQGYDETLAACDSSLERLGLDRLDLYLVHWPIPELMEQTWRAMEHLLEQGRTRAIGVCNFLPHHLDMLAELAEVPPAVDQSEFHPRLQQPQMVSACRERDITVQAWAPIMKGRVGEVPEIVRIAREHGRSPAQVTLRWVLQRGMTTIPKSVHPERIGENADIFDFQLDTAQMAVMDSLDTGERLGPDPDSFGG